MSLSKEYRLNGVSTESVQSNRILVVGVQNTQMNFVISGTKGALSSRVVVGPPPFFIT